MLCLYQLPLYEAQRLLKHPDDEPHQNRREKSSLPDAADLLEPAERDENRGHHDGDVKTDLGRAEREAVLLRNRADKSVTRHEGDIRQKLKRDAGRQHGTAEQLFHQAEQVALRNVKRGDPHPQVDKEAEPEKRQQLPQPGPVKAAAQNGELHQQKEDVETDRRHPQSPGNDERRDIGQA